MKKALSILVGCALAASPLRAQFYSDVTFVGSVHTGGYSAIGGISATVTNGGYYTNATTWTNYYRLCGTNAGGRIPLSTNVVVTFTGSSISNAVVLSWTRAAGVGRQVIEKSLDGGATWTNWLTLAPTVTSWTDTGSNTWTGTVFTNLHTEIVAGTYPWAPVDLVTPWILPDSLTNRMYRVGLITAGSGMNLDPDDYGFTEPHFDLDPTDRSILMSASGARVTVSSAGLTVKNTDGDVGLGLPYPAIISCYDANDIGGMIASNNNLFSGGLALTPTNSWSTNAPFLKSDDGTNIYWGSAP